jgi:hypothetical protein
MGRTVPTNIKNDGRVFFSISTATYVRKVEILTARVYIRKRVVNGTVVLIFSDIV